MRRTPLFIRGRFKGPSLQLCDLAALALRQSLEVPSRLLMGPGPSNAHPRVLAAQALPLLGHMHPHFFKIMDEIQGGLRYLFQTDSPYTLCISGTGHAGMEAVIANLLEPGDKIVVANNGIWGERVADMAGRFRAEVVQLRAPAGKTFSTGELKAALEEHKPAALFLVQGESSTGAHQALGDGLGAACRAAGALLIVDTVASLGGVPFLGDAWGVDAAYTGSQKCLSAPPGAAPLFLGPRAIEKLRGRGTKPATYNLDLNLIGDYWGWFGKRSYHHTGMVSMWYAMREALAIAGDEGLEAMWARHSQAHRDLWEGLRALGLEPFVEKDADRLITVNTIKVPPGIDFAALTAHAMANFSVEISGGLGPTAGKVWRVGLMGANATPASVQVVLAAFRAGLAAQGWKGAQAAPATA
ncbi:Serine--pyruvate aminotransferase [Monoraphidium neglectum]|uniref:alanine--glyoxylate transaminase n=1 Tax=Monoraphidium neglectum TaxID=145388 RepID=A0A0D2JUT8_9CHLO|nr:Serine--pyruvate aminotransferase [Monoraphidium neglectum]KIZ02593.1 Serine--pyruvate aminotransferase [Monoraphidium neglectum]|eukprot:XP_013901612.1 Serine--pyruvate aminotransferase [Monoraphidium neglectum]